MAQSLDAGVLLQEGAPERREQYLPEDFLLHEESTNIRGTVYYSLCSPKLPGRGLALRVNTLDCISEIVLEKSSLVFLCARSRRRSFRSGFCGESAGSPSPKEPNTWRE